MRQPSAWEIPAWLLSHRKQLSYQAVLIKHRPQAIVCTDSQCLSLCLCLCASVCLSLLPPLSPQCLLWHIVHKSYFSSRPQILNKWEKRCGPIECRGKPSSLFCGWTANEETLDKSVLCVMAPGPQPVYLLAGTTLFRQAELSSRKRDRTKKHSFHKSGRFSKIHLNWIRARDLSAMECLSGSWHFNDLISLGRIFLWVVSSIVLSPECSCHITVNFYYLPRLPTRGLWGDAAQDRRVISCNPLKESAV